MAGGLGRRFGGTKQLALVGPNGEAFIDYAINDGIAAGCDRVVVIVRSEIEVDVARHLAKMHPDGPQITLVCQDKLGPSRNRPWGTSHAVLSAAEALDAPFIVVNADDYYGTTSYTAAVDTLRDCSPDEAMLTVFELSQTLPETGSVSRGVCDVEGGYLVSIEELAGLERNNGDVVHNGSGRVLNADSPVSLNLWGFQPEFLEELRVRVEKFVRNNADNDSAECQLPTTVHDLISESLMRVRVVQSHERWIGITNPEDLHTARDRVSAVR
jgi:NDP-sugar pyrophosphorylase family protein